VQGRWTHLNREYSVVTRAQALGIDGHFGVEQPARCWTGWFLNFNGSGGIWRRRAIEDAGGWSADTLTEDLDLSYRVQLRGWRITYDPDLACPSELPGDLAAFKSQQRRWSTGSIQTARKVLPSVWRSDAGLGAKIQATLHLSHYAVHSLIALTALLSIPCIVWRGIDSAPSLYALLIPFVLAMSGPMTMYVYSQKVLGHAPARFRDLGMLTLLGIGISVSNSWAVIRAFLSDRGTFVRTPKLGTERRGETPVHRYRAPPDRFRRIEVGLAVYCLVASAAMVWSGIYLIAPFLLLDAAGFASVAAIGSLEARE
jgi:hypothetical protein